MSLETLDWLNQNTLIGFTKERGTAWHYRKGATNHFDGPVPIERARQLFEFTPMVIKDTYEWNGTLRETGQVKILRSDTGDYLGTFANGYQPHNYREWLLNKVELLLDDNLAIGSAGLLRNGAQAWVTIEIPDTITVESVGEAFRPSLLAYTSLDGSLATTYKLNIIRVVCDNTLSAAARTKLANIKVRHTSNSLGRLNILTARTALGLVFQAADSFAEEIEALASKTVTDQQWQRFLDLHMGDRPDEKGRGQTMYDNKRQALSDLYRTDERVAPWAGTAWGVLQAVNTYEQHLATIRKTLRPIRNMDRTLRGDFDKLDMRTADELLVALS